MPDKQTRDERLKKIMDDIADLRCTRHNEKRITSEVDMCMRCLMEDAANVRSTTDASICMDAWMKFKDE